jgi:hypothetical protein
VAHRLLYANPLVQGGSEMETDWAELFIAVLASRKFTKFFDGVDLVLPDGKKTNIKIHSYHKSPRLEGFRFSKFSFYTKAIASSGLEGHGFGEGETELLAFQKSIAEAVERAVYRSMKPYHNLISSNGWAAHLTAEKANKSALNELLERDAILTHWLTQTPFLEIDPATFPTWVKTWRDRELSKSKDFNRLRLLLSNVGHIPVVQSLILNKNGNAFISQGASKSIDTATYRALAETCRIATIAHTDRSMNDLNSESSKATPWDHALAYATERKFPDWVFGKSISYQEASKQLKEIYGRADFNKVLPKFQIYRCGDLFISQCRSEKLQNLFFGRGDFALKKGLINLDRLREVRSVFVLNSLPHCVP